MIELDDIIKYDKLEEAQNMVERLADDMLINQIGRIATPRDREASATHILYVVKELLGDKCKKVLDIGTLWGGSVMTMMQSEHKSHFVSIDLFNGYYKELTGHSVDPVINEMIKEYPEAGIKNGTNTIEIVTKNIDTYNKHNHPYDLVQGSSYDSKIIKKVHSLLGGSIDLLFIDGDHRKEGVIKDWEAYSELVSTGGVVIFDDHWLGVLGERYAWAKNKRHWDEPERMDVVGAYEEIKFRPMFLEKWKQVGLVVDKLILQRR